jgi:hypothetical protein
MPARFVRTPPAAWCSERGHTFPPRTPAQRLKSRFHNTDTSPVTQALSRVRVSKAERGRPKRVFPSPPPSGRLSSSSAWCRDPARRTGWSLWRPRLWVSIDDWIPLLGIETKLEAGIPRRYTRATDYSGRDSRGSLDPPALRALMADDRTTMLGTPRQDQIALFARRFLHDGFTSPWTLRMQFAATRRAV